MSLVDFKVCRSTIIKVTDYILNQNLIMVTLATIVKFRDLKIKFGFAVGEDLAILLN